jgi:hypothetical protein
MKKLVKVGIVAIIMAMSVILFSPKQGIAQTIPARVEAVYRATALATEIPLRVPSLVPLISPAAPAEYWASSIAPSSSRYIISFDRAADCTDVEECSFALVRGELNSESSLNFQELSAQTRNEIISLSDGTPAVFSPSREGIYTPASVFVQVADYLYTFSIYMADKDDVLQMANSALQIYAE